MVSGVAVRYGVEVLWGAGSRGSGLPTTLILVNGGRASIKALFLRFVALPAADRRPGLGVDLPASCKIFLLSSSF